MLDRYSILCYNLFIKILVNSFMKLNNSRYVIVSSENKAFNHYYVKSKIHKTIKRGNGFCFLNSNSARYIAV